MAEAPRIVWFRQDLRVADNPALRHAAELGPVLPVYVLDESSAPEGRPLGGASRWWLHHSLAALKKELGGLLLLRGDASVVIGDLARRTKAAGVHWNRCYEPAAIARDTALKAQLTGDGFDAVSFNGSLLNEPWDVRTGEGGPYKVYSPYWRACLKLNVAAPVAAPASLKLAPIPRGVLFLLH